MHACMHARVSSAGEVGTHACRAFKTTSRWAFSRAVMPASTHVGEPEQTSAGGRDACAAAGQPSRRSQPCVGCCLPKQGIGNGLPLAAVVTTPEVAQTLAQRLHFNTYGGNPVCCAGGRAVLRAVDEDGIQANAAKVLQPCHRMPSG